MRTVDIASRNRRPPNVDWRIGHTYSFLGAMEALDAGDTRAALAEALIRGQRGEFTSSLARRAITRILGGDLRTLERCQHTLRQLSAPITSAATVSTSSASRNGASRSGGGSGVDGARGRGKLRQARRHPHAASPRQKLPIASTRRPDVGVRRENPREPVPVLQLHAVPEDLGLGELREPRAVEGGT